MLDISFVFGCLCCIFLDLFQKMDLQLRMGRFRRSALWGGAPFECSVFHYDKEFGTTARTSHDKSFEAPSYVCTFYFQRILPNFSTF